MPFGSVAWQWRPVSSCDPDPCYLPNGQIACISTAPLQGVPCNKTVSVGMLYVMDADGKNLGANLDPSHFFWQGIDPVESARYLGENECIFHVHAKDCATDKRAAGICGVLDTKSYGDLKNRGWVFRTVGYGHGDEFWKPFISMLRMYDYDGVLSIEHEDSLMSMREGFEKAVAYLNTVIIREEAGVATWF